MIGSAKALPGMRSIRLMAAVTQQAARHLYLKTGFRVFGTEPLSLKIGDEFVDENHMTLEFEDSPAWNNDGGGDRPFLNARKEVS